MSRQNLFSAVNHGRESPLEIGDGGVADIFVYPSTSAGIGRFLEKQTAGEITLLPKQRPKRSAMKTKKSSEVYLQPLLGSKIKVSQKGCQ